MSSLIPGDSVRVSTGLRGTKPVGVVTGLLKRIGAVEVVILHGELAGKKVTRMPEELKRYHWPAS